MSRPDPQRLSALLTAAEDHSERAADELRQCAQWYRAAGDSLVDAQVLTEFARIAELIAATARERRLGLSPHHPSPQEKK